MTIQNITGDVVSHGIIAKSKSHQKETPEVNLIDIFWVEVQIMDSIDLSNTTTDSHYEEYPEQNKREVSSCVMKNQLDWE